MMQVERRRRRRAVTDRKDNRENKDKDYLQMKTDIREAGTKAETIEEDGLLSMGLYATASFNRLGEGYTCWLLTQSKLI